MTPDESRAQVVDAAADVVRDLKLTVTSANFSRASCNDQGDPPFHGEVTIFYPSDAGRADDEVEHMTQALLGAGWTSDGDFKSHATALTKGNVDAVFYPANASVARGHIDLIGECRDVTTTKPHAGIIEDLSLR